jgi:hypothetical protein
MKINICPICIAVSLLWLILSAGVVWGYLESATFIVPIALLMGGTVVGIAYLGEKRCRWAAQHQLLWKTLIIIGGMPIAYLLIINLNKLIIVIELLILIKIAYFFFIKQPTQTASGSGLPEKAGISEIKEKMEQCC